MINMKFFKSISWIVFAVVSFNQVYTHEDTQKSDISESRFMVDAVIRQLFEILRGVIINGDEEKNIPVLEPVEFNTITIDHQGSILNLKADIQNSKLTGLGGFKVIKAELNKVDLSIDFDVKFPSIKFTAENYLMLGNLFEFIILRGNGKIDIDVEDFRFMSKVYLKQSDDGLSILISSLEDPKYDIKRISSRTDFDDNMDDIFNAIIEDLFAYYLNRFSSFVCKSYTENIIDLLNPLLNKFESWRIISTIL